MKKGQSVKVKEGVYSPDFDELCISGWQGQILEIYREENTVLFALDSITLENMPVFYIKSCIEDGCDFSELCLGLDDVELTNSRDDLSDVQAIIEDLYEKYSGDDDFENTINRILTNKNQRRTDSNNLRKFRDYLNENLKKSILLTGSIDFEWEEPYVMGVFSQKEYKELKKTRASYTDKYEFLELDDSWDDLRGLSAKVKRVSDGRIFHLPLWDLKTVDPADENAKFISCYSYWMSNY